MTSSSLLGPADTVPMTPVTQTWCPLFARIESFTNKDKNLHRADNNWLVRQTLYIPTLSSKYYCMVSPYIFVLCSMFWSELKLVRRGFWSQHEGKTRDMTPTRMMLKLKLNAGLVLPTMIFSIIMMFDLLDRGRKTVKCKYSASISDRPQLRRHRDGETMMSRWPGLGQCQPIRGQHGGHRPIRGRERSRNTSIFWFSARSGAQECSVQYFTASRKCRW